MRNAGKFRRVQYVIITILDYSSNTFDSNLNFQLVRFYFVIMSSDPNVEDEHSQADDIAAEITKILVKAFVAKEGREPTTDEVQMLIEELTEERIESMLGGVLDAETNGADSEDGSDQEEDGSEASEEEVVPDVAHTNELTDNQKRSLVTTDEKNEDEASNAKKAKVDEVKTN